jgi:heat shock protein HslJ
VKPALIALLLLPLLAGCQNERQQLGQALSGKPPVVAGSLIGRWTMADLNGGGAVAGGMLEFSADKLAGTAGCNRLMGSWQENGAVLTIGPLAATRMACAPAAMSQEQRVMALLAMKLTVQYGENGGVTLIVADGRRLRLVPAQPEPPR